MVILQHTTTRWVEPPCELRPPPITSSSMEAAAAVEAIAYYSVESALPMIAQSAKGGCKNRSQKQDKWVSRRRRHFFVFRRSVAGELLLLLLVWLETCILPDTTKYCYNCDKTTYNYVFCNRRVFETNDCYKCSPLFCSWNQGKIQLFKVLFVIWPLKLLL